MNDVSQQNKKKDSILKTLAVTGFIGIIILIAWLSIQFVQVIPNAFSSLASLAEGLNDYRESTIEEDVTKLNVTSNTTLVNAGESVDLSWDTVTNQGSYTFSYECTEGVAIDIVSDDGQQSIACDTNYNIGDTDALSLMIDSEKARYADVSYTVSFLGTNDTEPRAAGTASLTVMNSTIQNNILAESSQTETVNNVETTSETETVTEVTTENEETEEAEESVTETTNEETVTETTPGTPVYEQEFVYTIPVSNPNGKTDLATKFISSGTIVGNTFFPGEIMQDEKGAIQFEVKNYGTKTSDTWTFTVSLPGGGEYESAVQNPLKPNERAVLTIGFFTTDESSHTFKVEVDGSTDNNPLNDSFTQTVKFLK